MNNATAAPAAGNASEGAANATAGAANATAGAANATAGASNATAPTTSDDAPVTTGFLQGGDASEPDYSSGDSDAESYTAPQVYMDADQRIK